MSDSGKVQGGMRFFGGWHCEASLGHPQIETPVGEKCAGHCESEILDGDKGVRIGAIGFTPTEPDWRRFGAGPSRLYIGPDQQLVLAVTTWHQWCFLEAILGDPPPPPR